MTNKYIISHPTGLFIPVEKQSIFMLAFEDKLVSTFNVVPFFGSATRRKSCEIKFNYLGNKSYKPESFARDIENAMGFLKSNLSVLDSKKTYNRKRKRKSNSFLISPQVINLEDESDPKTADSTNIVQVDPEVIVLEDSIIETRRSSTCSSVVDLTDLNESSRNPVTREQTESDIAVLKVKRSLPKTLPLKRETSSEITILNVLSSPSNNIHQREDKNIRPKKRLNSSGTKSESSIDSLPRKKRKLQDISNINSSASPSSVKKSGLSENVLRYYKNIAKVASKTDQKKKDSSIDFIPIVENNQLNNARKSQRILKNTLSFKVLLEANGKRKVVSSQPNCSSRDISNQQRYFGKKNMNKHSSPGRKLRKSLRKRINKISEANSFNPNPHEVDQEGLRPIVVDGSNVAIGFIVQYATEFGGVIVSTDNYRDISQENPRWQDTIAKRLLMFTWVDDFLMFPVDPLGRSGPTLEEFLRF